MELQTEAILTEIKAKYLTQINAIYGKIALAYKHSWHNSPKQN